MARMSAEFPLKALVFADDCDSSSFSLFSATKYIHSKPVLTWQLSTLARYGVKEAIVLSSAPMDIPYSDPLKRMEIKTLSSPAWRGEGDALRDIEGRSDIRPQDDFIIVRCGSIFNIDVGRLVKEHKARRAKNRNWLLTAVFRQGTAGFSSGLVIAVDSGSGTLIKYSERCTTGVSVDVRADSAGLSNGGSVGIYSDVVDVGVDVCAPDVLLEFKDNFDFDRVRALTREKLESGDAETLGNRMYAHFTSSGGGEYASRIDSLAALAQTTSDMFKGWMLPMSLSGIAAPHQVHVFEDDVFVCPSVKPQCATKQSAKAFHMHKWSGRNCVVGRDTMIEDGAQIINSVVGDSAVIGKGTVIENSIIGNNTRIGENVVIENCILSDKCVVHKKAKLPPRCFLDEGVAIGPDYTGMRSGSLLSTEPDSSFSQEQEFDDFDNTGPIESITEELAAWRLEDVGAGGVGRLVHAPIPTSDPFFDADPMNNFFRADGSDDDDELEEPAGGVEDDHDFSESRGFETLPVNGAGAKDPNQLLSFLDTDMVEFHKEICDLLERDRVENIALDNTILEANSLRLSYDLTFAEMLAGVILGIGRSAIAECRERGGSNIYAAFVKAFKKYVPLLEKYTQLEKKHDFDVVCVLSLLFEREGDTLCQLLFVLYDQDVIEEDGIFLWAEKEQQAIASGEKDCSPFEKVKAFIEWLQKDDD